jgi:Na+/melibiose symporter-like transporter
MPNQSVRLSHMPVISLFSAQQGAERRLAYATFINMLGTGLFATTSALFFTRSVGLPGGEVGIGLTASGLVGLAGGAPFGRLADRCGPHRVWVTSLIVESAAMAGFVLVHSFTTFLLVNMVGQIANSASSAARLPVVRSLGGARSSRFRAQLRAIGNLAAGCGMVAAAAAVQIDTRTAYVSLVLGDSISFAGCALVAATLPRIKSSVFSHRARWWGVLGDRPFVAVIGVNAILSLQYPVLSYALPLWIVYDTGAPRALAAGAAIINTVIIVIFQVRAGRNIDTLEDAGRAMRSASFMLACAAVIVSFSRVRVSWMAVLIIVSAIVVQTSGEMRQAAAAYLLSFGLAPPEAQGEYGGAFNTGTSLAVAIGPALLWLLCLDWRGYGWWLLAGLMAAAGAMSTRTIRWAEQSRRRLAD